MASRHLKGLIMVSSKTLGSRIFDDPDWKPKGRNCKCGIFVDIESQYEFDILPDAMIPQVLH